VSVPAPERKAGALSRLKRPGTLTSEVVAYIRDAVIRGELEPEQPLSEVRLAQELETARVTVRVALRALADVGLVEIVPHRGAFVSSLTPRKAWEIFSLRALLESYAVRLALDHGPLPTGALDDLERILARIAETAEEDDPTDLIEAVMAFHLTIAQLSGHELLVAQLENLQTQTRRLIFYTKLYQSDPMSEVDSHQQVLDALRSGDGAAAERVVFEHHEAAGDRLVQRMTEQDARRRAEPPPA
jgi:DNA-binding GntR family transcriptional regulator